MTGGAPRAEAPATDLSVMTFNIRTALGVDGRNLWWLRRPATAEAIRLIGPDVAGLQEVRQCQLRYLRRQLPGYQFLSAGRADGRRRGEHCPILFRRDRFGVESWEIQWFSDDRTGRIATMALLRDRADGRTFRVINTHLDHRSAQVRLDSAALLTVWAQVRPGPTVLLGDFNAIVTARSVARLLADGWRDALDHVPPKGPGAGTAHKFTGRDDGPRIDHILVVGGYRVAESTIVRERPRGRLPSDHWPVTARLRRDDVVPEE